MHARLHKNSLCFTNKNANSTQNKPDDISTINHYDFQHQLFLIVHFVHNLSERSDFQWEQISHCLAPDLNNSTRVRGNTWPDICCVSECECVSQTHAGAYVCNRVESALAIQPKCTHTHNDCENWEGTYLRTPWQQGQWWLILSSHP